MDKESIVFYKDWWDAISELPEDIQHKAIKAVMDYAFKGEEPEDMMLRFATAQIRMFINRDRKRYETICDKRREAIKKRWSNQKNTNNTNEYNSIQIDTTHYHNENENENENNNDNENEHGLSNESINNNIKKEIVIKKKTAERFIAPTIEEVQEYATQKGYSIDAEHFVNYYTANGWRVGRNPMKDWRAAVRTWVVRDRGQAQPQRTQSLGVGEYINDKGIRTYGNSGQAVPPEAPPRPSEAHWWSEASQNWENMI